MRDNFMATILLPGIIVAALFTSPAQAHYGTPFGDYNNNGVVDAADYVVWRDTVGSTTNLAADGNRGGGVTTADYDFWRARFGNVVQPDLLPNPAPASFTNSPWLGQLGITPSLADEVNYGEGITIGIVDSGINSAHPAFAGHLSSQGACYIYCDGGVTDNGVGSVTTDGSGHGTAVATIAAGGEYNGVVGVAAKATVLPIKVYPSDGSAIPDASTIAYGARLAADRGANVINISSTPPHGLTDADRAAYYKNFGTDVNYVATQNAVTVFAGGDEAKAIVGSLSVGTFGAGFTTSAIQRMIFVGGVDANNNLVAMGNTPGTGKLFITTGGTIPISDRWIVASNSVIGLDGTSLTGTDYAAAQVAGAIALLDLKWPQVKIDGTASLILLSTATDLGTIGIDPVYGHGLLNLQAAFQPIGGVSTVTATGEQVPIDQFTNNPDGSISVPQLDPRIVDFTAYDTFGRDFPIRVVPVASVPEPATWLLLASASLGLGCYRHRRCFNIGVVLTLVANALYSSSAHAHYGTPYGDYNNNGVVDAADYIVWRDTLGSTTNLAADGNRGGGITSVDYDYWRAWFGNIVQPDLLPNPAPASFTSSPWLGQSGITLSLADDVNYGEGITIGFVDSGINSAHLTFAGHLSSQGACYIYCDGGIADNGVGSVTTDGSGHGTAIAAIAAGGSYNGVVGVAAKATVLPIKVYPSDGSAVPAASTIAYGARLAADRGANIINISETPPHGLDDTDRANFYKAFSADLNYAASLNAVTVLAGGDEGQTIVGTRTAGVPGTAFDSATIQRMIFVGGVDANNNLTATSNMPGTGQLFISTGGTTRMSDRWLVVNDSVVSLNGTQLSGTDYAAAQVAGAIALLELKWPQVKADGTAANILLITATDLGTPGTDAIYGHGLLNMQAAFQPIGGVGGLTATGGQVPIDEFTNNADGGINVLRLDPKIVNLTAYDGFGRDFPIRVLSSDTIPIPEPATWLLLILALFGLGCFRRRRAS